MRVHQVHCHPCRDSFSAALDRAVGEALTASGHEVDRLDLYAEGFDPVLPERERRLYHDEGPNVDAVRAYVERLLAADALVFVYPTWWFGLPAALKGWFDRVWLPGVAFTMPTAEKGIGPALLKVRKIGVVTTYGAPWWFARYVGEPGVRTISRGVKPLCAKGCRFSKHAHYKIDSSTPASRAAFLERVERDYRRF